jgi:hypothetical protein
VAPCARDVAGRVAAAADEEEGPVVAFYGFDAEAVGFDVEVEAAEAVAAEGVGAGLEDDGLRVVFLDDGACDGGEEVLVLFVVDAVVDGDVEAVAFAAVGGVRGAHFVDVAGAWEEGVAVAVDAVFVVREGEDAVGGFKGLFDAVAVVHVNVDVEDALVLGEEELDGNDDVVDVAEAGCEVLLRMMQTAGPVDGDVGLLVKKVPCCAHRGAAVEGDVVPETIEDGAVV